MANEMSWKECVDGGIITPSVPDEERSNQMLMMANPVRETLDYMLLY